jgi:hypothetical protein
MAFPSRVLGAGTSGGTTTAICGDVSVKTSGGTTIADAIAVSAAINSVSGALNSGVIIPPAETGAMVVVSNTNASNAIKVYPQTGTTIDGIAAATGVSIAGGKTRIFFGITPTSWVSALSA